MYLGIGIQQVMFMTLVRAIAAVGAAVFVIDQADRFDAMNLDSKLNVFQDHLVIVNTSCQRDDVKIVISKTDCDPRLEEFLQAIIHTVDN